MYPSQQTFLILGLSRSGTAVAEFLLKHKSTVYLYDDLTSDNIEKTTCELENLGGKRVKKEDLPKMQEICDAVVLSPGIPIDHPVSISFRRAGKAILGETELASRLMRCPVVAVTGTNGKTTTVSMIEKVLQESGKRVEACGNVGSPMIKHLDLTSNDVAVAEISSFQLETLNSLRPHIAVVLNVTEDHLNRHYNMENYIFLKKKILKNSTEMEYAVLNYDDETVRRFEDSTRAKKIFFSLREKVDGAYVKENCIYYFDEKIMEIESLLLIGKHNLQNALATVCVAKLLGVETQVISRALGGFKGIKHRIERVGTIDGVEYIDDSKATNVDATLKAVGAIKSEIVLLLGGKDKGYDYDKLFLAIRNSSVVKSILYGENRMKLLESAMRTGNKSVSLCDNFTVAVNVAKLTATPSQTVLLSPASASFDEFSGYEERGDKFVEIIEGFKNEKQDLQAVEEKTTSASVEETLEESTDVSNFDDGEIE